MNVVSQNFDYDADRRVHFIHNLLDSNFDRIYSYDHAGRLTYASTGGSARNDYGSTPYSESFQYDVWGNTTQRQTSSWDQQFFSEWSIYNNNRNINWSYDADGRETQIDTRHNSYDSAGRQTGMTGQQWWVYQYIPYSQTCQYDGDGQKVKDSGTGVNSYTTYYLRSSVLKGAVISEINSSGQKTTGYIYTSGGRLLAKQVSGIVAWEHMTPINTSKYEIQSNNGIVNQTELDPVGADVGLTAPMAQDTGGGDGDIGSNHAGGRDLTSRYADMFNPSGGCTLDGFAASCSFAISLVNSGAARVDTILDFGGHGGAEDLLPMLHPVIQHVVTDNGTIKDQDTGEVIAAADRWSDVPHLVLEISGFDESAFNEHALGPQNTPCEKLLARTFTDDPNTRFVDVTDGDGYDPIIQSDRTPRDEHDDEHNHIYNAESDIKKHTNIFAPGGGQVVGSGVLDGQNWMSVYYKRLGGVNNVILQIWHVENYNGRGGIRQNGRILLGQMGENGNIRYGPPGSPEGWHVHINAYTWWGTIKNGRLIGNTLGLRKVKEEHRLKLSDLFCK